jgi:hypothetical protein
VVLEVCLARFMFALGESACRSRAHPDKPASFMFLVAVERTAVETVNDLVGVVIGLVRVTYRVCSRRLPDGCQRH